MKHYSSLVRHRRSFARLSTDPGSETCVVFVHGFFGNVENTWGEFADGVDALDLEGEAFWGQADLYFFDYGAEKSFVKSSADELARFLEQIFPKPAMSAFGLIDRDEERIRKPWKPYTRIILVGHSLGGAVIRECVENQFRSASGPAEWVRRSDLRLFASAQIGFQFAGWKELLFRMAPRHLTSIPALWRAFPDLQKGSGVLTDLRRRTEGLSAKHPFTSLRARLMYGRNEDVVAPGEFDCDWSLEWLEGHDHVSLCKPSRTFTAPFEFVRGDVHGKPARA